MDSVIISAQIIVNYLLYCGIFAIIGIMFYGIYIKFALLGYNKPRKKTEALYFTLYNAIIVFGAFVILTKYNNNIGIIVLTSVFLNAIFGFLFMFSNTEDRGIDILFFLLYALMVTFYAIETTTSCTIFVYEKLNAKYFSPLGIFLVICSLICWGLVSMLSLIRGNIAKRYDCIFLGYSIKREYVFIIVGFIILSLQIGAYIYPAYRFMRLGDVACALYLLWLAMPLKPSSIENLESE